MDGVTASKDSVGVFEGCFTLEDGQEPRAGYSGGLLEAGSGIGVFGTDETWEVYVIAPEGGPYKVGISKDTDGRLRTLQTGNHAKLEIVGRLPMEAWMARMVEQGIHRRLGSRRLTGEWFAVEMSCIDYALSQSVIEALDWRVRQLQKEIARLKEKG